MVLVKKKKTINWTNSYNCPFTSVFVFPWVLSKPVFRKTNLSKMQTDYQVTAWIYNPAVIALDFLWVPIKSSASGSF